MAQITNYSTLQTEIGNWINRGDSTADIPTWIQLAEARIKRVLRTKHKTLQSVAVTADTGSYTVTDAVENMAVFISAPAGDEGELNVVPIQDLFNNRRENYGLTARPKMVSFVGTTMYVSPVPDSSYTLQLSTQAFTPLSTTNTTNTILTEYPDVYLYGALVAAEPFLQNDSRMPMWKSMYDEALAELEIARDRWEYPHPVQKAPLNLAPISTIKGGR